MPKITIKAEFELNQDNGVVTRITRVFREKSELNLHGKPLEDMSYERMDFSEYKAARQSYEIAIQRERGRSLGYEVEIIKPKYTTMKNGYGAECTEELFAKKCKEFADAITCAKHLKTVADFPGAPSDETISLALDLFPRVFRIACEKQKKEKEERDKEREALDEWRIKRNYAKERWENFPGKSESWEAEIKRVLSEQAKYGGTVKPARAEMLMQEVADRTNILVEQRWQDTKPPRWEDGDRPIVEVELLSGEPCRAWIDANGNLIWMKQDYKKPKEGWEDQAIAWRVVQPKANTSVDEAIQAGMKKVNEAFDLGNATKRLLEWVDTIDKAMPTFETAEMFKHLPKEFSKITLDELRQIRTRCRR